MTFSISQLVRGHKATLIFAAILMLGLVVRLYEVGEPWIGHHDWNGARESRLAQNYLRFGYLATRLGPTLDTGSIQPAHFTYYMHHPPLAALMVSVAFATLGVHEWSARLVPILFSIGTLFLLYLLSREVYSSHEALIACFFLSLMPMQAYFGRMVNHEAPTLFFSLLAVLCYVRWVNIGDKKFYVGAFTGLILATLTDWPAYYLVPLLIGYYLIFEWGCTKSLGFVLQFSVIGMLSFLAFIVHAYYLTGSFDELAGTFRWRLAPGAGYWFSAQEFVAVEYARIIDLFTPTLGLLAVLWLMSFGIEIARRKNVKKHALVVLLLLWGGIPSDFPTGSLDPRLLAVLSKPVFCLVGCIRNAKHHKIPVTWSNCPSHFVHPCYSLFLYEPGAAAGGIFAPIAH